MKHCRPGVISVSYEKKSRGRNASPKNDWRCWVVIFFFFTTTLTIGGRLFFLQIFSQKILSARAQKQYQFSEQLAPSRGQVYLKDGTDNFIPVATNEKRDLVFIVPKEIEDIEGTVKTLATILSLDEEGIRQKVLKKNDPYEVIKKKLTKEESRQLLEKKMKGVGLLGEDWRYYSEGEFLSQVLGFVGNNGEKREGRYGIENYFNNILEGESGFMKAEKDTAGRWIPIKERVLEQPKDGAEIVLTIDQTVQYFVEKLLKESLAKYEATSGSILVMDPKTGAIIAMANQPTFNNNDFGLVEDSALFKNNSIAYQFEPGSIFKPFTFSIALEAGGLKPDSTYFDKGVYSVGGFNIHNANMVANGETTLTRALELSLNTGAIWAMQSVPKEKFLDYLKKYGFGETTGIELTGEASGDLANLKFLRDINFATSAFGQGVSVTSLQLVTAFSAVVNGGELMKPQIVERFIYPGGKIEKVFPEAKRRVISPETSKKMREMLVSVVKNGWSKKANIPGYEVGGKTGTAQMPNLDGPGYGNDTIHSYMGFGPAEDPRFVTLVRLDRARKVNFSSDSAAPITGKLNNFLLDFYHIFPTKEIKPEEQQYYDRLMQFNEEDLKKAREEAAAGQEGFSL